MIDKKSSPETPDATVVIVSRNRRDTLRVAIESCLQQTGVAFELLVIDDASDDDTSQMVSEAFPQVRLITYSERKGLIVRRNNGFEEARGRFVFSLDDDARFTDPSTVRQAVDFFRTDPMIGAIALRYVEPNRTQKQGYMSEIPNGTQVRNYIGCAHAVRVDVARELGGYRGYLVHQGEERDLCIRMLDSGYTVKYLNTPPIVHEPSPIRDHSRIYYLGHRNTFLFDVINVPFPSVLWRLPADVLLLLKHRITLRALPLRAFNTIRALFACTLFLPKRSPVSAATYAKYSQLPMHGPVSPATMQDAIAVGKP